MFPNYSGRGRDSTPTRGSRRSASPGSRSSQKEWDAADEIEKNRPLRGEAITLKNEIAQTICHTARLWQGTPILTEHAIQVSDFDENRRVNEQGHWPHGCHDCLTNLRAYTGRRAAEQPWTGDHIPSTALFNVPAINAAYGFPAQQQLLPQCEDCQKAQSALVIRLINENKNGNLTPLANLTPVERLLISSLGGTPPRPLSWRPGPR